MSTNATVQQDTTTNPVCTPLVVETARWWTVTDAPTLLDAQGREFTPGRVKVLDRPFTGWMAVVFGHLLDAAGDVQTARVFDAQHDTDQAPRWVLKLVRGGPHRTDVRELLGQIERYACGYVDMPHPEAERDDIERQVLALATAAGIGAAGQVDRPWILVRQVSEAGEDRLHADIRGVSCGDEAAVVLLKIVEELTDVRVDSYLRLVDVVREIRGRL